MSGLFQHQESPWFSWIIGYYRKIVNNYGSLAAPLSNFFKKGDIEWNKKAQVALERLKNAMVALHKLALPKFSQPFEIETDSSRFGIGEVLLQSKRPIAYFAHVLSIRDRMKLVYEQELVAVVLVVQGWPLLWLKHD